MTASQVKRDQRLQRSLRKAARRAGLDQSIAPTEFRGMWSSLLITNVLGIQVTPPSNFFRDLRRQIELEHKEAIRLTQENPVVSADALAGATERSRLWRRSLAAVLLPEHGL